MNWFAEQRMLWIAETLLIFGFINRDHLRRKFYISVPKASQDLAEFRRRYPQLMTYDMSTKRYVRADRVRRAKETRR